MIVGWSEGGFRQKSGVCIGSCVAPVSREIYLGEVDCDMERALSGTIMKNVIRYVDDCLVIIERGEPLDTQGNTVVETFTKCGGP